MRRTLTYKNQTKPLSKWSEELGIEYNTLLARIKQGWSPEKTLTTTPGEIIPNHKHGLCGTKEYRAWLAMKCRCSDDRRHNAHRYVGRGITVCERWNNSFESFLDDVGPAPTAKHSLGRINNDKNYEPGNCRWETAKEQAANRSTSVRHCCLLLENCNHSTAQSR